LLTLISRLFSDRRPAPRRQRRVQLSLESLESRDCLTAPQITSFAVTPLDGHLVLLSGQVTGNPPGGTVTFGGVVAGTTALDASNNFSLAAYATNLGAVTAVYTNGPNITSDAAQATLTSDPPVITLSLTHGPNRTVNVSGRVTDEAPGNRTVYFSGAATGSAVTNAYGFFTATLQATALGSLQASVTDPWGLPGTATISITNDPPVIVNFEASEQWGNLWNFSGQVLDESPGGLIVQFSGPNGIDGRTVTVAANGWFNLTVPVTQNGFTTVRVTDWWGAQSLMAWSIVSITPL